MFLRNQRAVHSKLLPVMVLKNFEMAESWAGSNVMRKIGGKQIWDCRME